MRKFIVSTNKKFPTVDFIFSDAITAMRRRCELKYEEIEMNAKIEYEGSKARLVIKALNLI